jgi:hypothetical protein
VSIALAAANNVEKTTAAAFIVTHCAKKSAACRTRRAKENACAQRGRGRVSKRAYFRVSLTGSSTAIDTSTVRRAALPLVALVFALFVKRKRTVGFLRLSAFHPLVRDSTRLTATGGHH